MLVCTKCGGKDVQVLAWVDANTNEFKGDGPEDEPWCEDCWEYVGLEEEENESNT